MAGSALTNRKSRAIGVSVRLCAGTRRAGRAPAAARGAAIAAALALLLAEWASLHHRTTEAHELCSDHADTPRAAELSSEADGDRDSQPGDGAAIFAADSAEDRAIGEEGCQLCRSWRERLTSPPLATICAELPAERHDAPRAALVDRAGVVAIVALAPKTSPPA